VSADLVGGRTSERQTGANLGDERADRGERGDPHANVELFELVPSVLPDV
jgi:hypothetical protein